MQHLAPLRPPRTGDFETNEACSAFEDAIRRLNESRELETILIAEMVTDLRTFPEFRFEHLFQVMASAAGFSIFEVTRLDRKGYRHALVLSRHSAVSHESGHLRHGRQIMGSAAPAQSFRRLAPTFGEKPSRITKAVTQVSSGPTNKPRSLFTASLELLTLNR